LEDLVLKARLDLAKGDLGAIGADAIRQALVDQGIATVPAVRTINRILGRRGALDGNKRTRRPPPPTGWYLPAVAAGKAELDSIDIVEGLVIKNGPPIEVLNGCSLHGGLVVSWPVASPVTATRTVQSLVEHGRQVGLPDYAPFDNDMIFHGTHRYPDALGRVIRLCLSLNVVPVPFLQPPTQEPDQSAANPRSGLSASQPRLPGLIALFGMYWQLSACAHFFVRDVLALTLLSRRSEALGPPARSAWTRGLP
jgi:hypothetical protein